jgi:hypothetical protein
MPEYSRSRGDGGTFRTTRCLEDSCPSRSIQVSSEPLEDAIIVRATGEVDMSTIDANRRAEPASDNELPRGRKHPLTHTARLTPRAAQLI